MVCLDYTYFFYDQPVYKQLALGWQVVKQLSGLNLFFTQQFHNSAVSVALLGKF